MEIEELTKQLDDKKEEKKENKKEVKEIKEVKKQNIENFNQSESAKVYDVRLITNKSFKLLIFVIILLSLLLIFDLAWKNIILNDFLKKDFSPQVINNLESPNITNNLTNNIDAKSTNNNEYKIYNNFTILNNVSVMCNQTI